MFCGKCGTNNIEGAVFCIACGSALASSSQSNPETMPAPRKKKILPLILALAAVAAVVVLLICLLGGGHGFSEPEDAALAAVEGVFDLDADRALQALYPEMAEDYEEEIEEGMEEMERMFKKNDVRADRFKARDTKAEYDKRTMRRYEDLLNDTYDLDVEITDMKEIRVSCDVEFEGGSERYHNTYIVFQVDDKWYVWPVEFGGGYSNPEDAALAWVQGLCDADAEAMLQTLCPEVADEIESEIKKEAKDAKEDREDYEYSFSDFDAVIVPAGYEGNVMMAIEEYFEEEYDSKVNLTNLHYIDVSFESSSIYGSDDELVTVIVFELDGKWYVWPRDYIDLYGE